MASPTTVVLVHGAWSTPAVYDRYIAALRTCGYTVHCPLLPTCNGCHGTFADDVTTIHELVSSLVTASKSVLMLMHSYGGTVGSCALAGLSRIEREKQGLEGGVVHLLYLAAYILPKGGSIIGIVKEAGVWDRWSSVIDVREDGSIFPEDPKSLVLVGLDEADQEVYAKRLVRFPGEALEMEITETPWKYIPTTYIYTAMDRCVPSSYQDIMLKRVKEAGLEIRREDFSCAHMVFLTHTHEMVAAVDRALYSRAA